MEIREYAPFNEAEISALYASVGWTAYTADLPALARGYARSLLVLGAYENGELLGIIRCVGDGETIVWIQDILVFPSHQRKGVGRALVRAVLDRYPRVRQIELATDDVPETNAFYKSLGFRRFSEIGCCGYMRF
jgi:ribosomal protein S18 acetylase RimI-like enzyme